MHFPVRMQIQWAAYKILQTKWQSTINTVCTTWMRRSSKTMWLQYTILIYITEKKSGRRISLCLWQEVWLGELPGHSPCCLLAAWESQSSSCLPVCICHFHTIPWLYLSAHSQIARSVTPPPEKNKRLCSWNKTG